LENENLQKENVSLKNQVKEIENAMRGYTATMSNIFYTNKT